MKRESRPHNTHYYTRYKGVEYRVSTRKTNWNSGPDNELRIVADVYLGVLFLNLRFTRFYIERTWFPGVIISQPNQEDFFDTLNSRKGPIRDSGLDESGIETVFGSLNDHYREILSRRSEQTV
ncbi:MAG: hypothetical protein WC796_04740 [Candidatus Pacearchaeota archaeon]|jgi:hypothetical protein